MMIFKGYESEECCFTITNDIIQTNDSTSTSTFVQPYHARGVEAPTNPILEDQWTFFANGPVKKGGVKLWNPAVRSFKAALE
ncbi:hypothetical protein V6N12_046730 [Hibiscus sabdariffa]|uniref:Uncharacterized protein n=1 Tax=Hibiscus sabdariffa TaxID=183260 RepID=A0ABR2ASS2_9ROSI